MQIYVKKVCRCKNVGKIVYDYETFFILLNQTGFFSCYSILNS